MSRPIPILTAIATLLLSTASVTSGQITASSFSYQGELKEDGVGVNSNRAHFLFSLWDAPASGHQIGGDVERTNVVITDGIFTVFLDFGETVFDGNPCYLEIRVDPDGGTSYVTLAPRQPITAAPFAVHALHGGDSPWTVDGTTITYDGEVGIGVVAPTYPLAVSSTRMDARVVSAVSTATDVAAVGVWGEVEATGGTGVYGKSGSTQGAGYGVHGTSGGADGTAVYGYAGTTSGAARGVHGRVRSTSAYGVHGQNTAPSGSAIGVYGETGSGTGFGGYFVVRGYFSSRLGIGTTSPATALEVVGTATMDGFKLDTGPQVGYVLTSDASGNGSWQPAPGGGGYWAAMGSDIYYNGGNVGIGTAYPSAKLDVLGTVEVSGLRLPTSPQVGYVLTSDVSGNGTWQPAPTGEIELPYNGSVSSTAPAFKVTNTGTSATSHGIYGEINNPASSGDAAAGSFKATGSNGFAITAFSDGRTAIYADHDGADWAVRGISSGAGGGRFSSSAAGGHGVEGVATGEAGNGVYATASGGGAALAAEATGASTLGIYAKGSTAAGRFNGNVQIYEYNTTNKVIELGKGLDYAEGFDVTEADTEDLPKGTVLVIDPGNPGHLTRCTQAYDRKVAGIVAGANGLGSGVRLGPGQFDHDVALAGRVYCNAVAFDDDIQPGDLLTTSDVPGRAMKVADHARAQGAVLGKAMEPLPAGKTGQILVLVTLQ